MARVLLFWAWIGSAMCCKDSQHRSTPIVAVLGRSVLLPCTNQSVNPDSVKNYRVYWQMLMVGQDPLVVHFLNLMKSEEPGSHHTRFQGRTKLYIEYGTFSLLLTDVRIDDEACYECLVSLEGRQSPRKSLVNLQVSAPYNEPVLHTREGPSNNSRTITCSASGGYPEPDVHWTIDGQLVPKDSRSVQTTITMETTKKATSGTYNVHSSLTAKASEHVECIIENKRLKENRSASVVGARTGVRGSASNIDLTLCDGYVPFTYLLVLWIFWLIYHSMCTSL